jgi:hypothetical protein
VPAAAGTVPAFTVVDGPTGANLNSAVCAYAVAAGTTDTSGTWTNATGISVEVWRGASSVPIGGHAQSGGSVASGGNVAVPAITLQDASANSVILAFAGWQTVTAWNAAPTGYTQRSQVATECQALTKNTTTSSAAFNVSGTASATGGTRTQQLEILADLGNRVSQEAVEALYKTSAAQARMSQEAVEALYKTTAAQARVSQVAVEALVKIPTVSARVSQVAVEVLKSRADVRDMDFIASVTVVHAPALIGSVTPGFIASHTVVYTPVLSGAGIDVPFISSVTVVHAPALGGQVTMPFIASKTHVWTPTLFDPNKIYGGLGNGGESFLIRLNLNGVTDTATLVADIGVGGSNTLLLSGDSAFPTDKPFVVTIDDEVILVYQLALGSYHVRKRAMSNTTAASHTAGANVDWNDHYDMPATSTDNIDASFTADINSTGSFTYNGWLICFDSSQAYTAVGDRYPMHVTELLGVFDSGAGSSGSNRCDSSQPNAISGPTGASDDCPVSLSNPARIATDISPGDVGLARYTNPEAFVLDLGPRSMAFQSWFGFKRVDSSNVDVSLTDPTGYIVDTIPSGGGPGPFTGSIDIEEPEPLPLVTGIAPDASDAAGFAIPTPAPVPWLTVTLPGTDRWFTYGSPGYGDHGWPICCIAVRQGKRRVPYWQSWDWHNYNFVYDGFGTDSTYAQLLINRNGIVFDSVPAVELPGTQDIDGPDAVWDDATYFFSACWYIVLFAAPYIVHGPGIGGSISISGGGGTAGYSPGVTFPVHGGPVTTTPPFIEGGAGGGIEPTISGLHIWETDGGFF